MSIGTIISYPKNHRVLKSLIASKYTGSKVATKDITFGVDNRSPSFLKTFPNGKVPVMETPEGPLFESNALAFYVASSVTDSPILGKSAYENARILNFLFFFDNELVSPIYQWFLAVIGIFPFDIVKIEEAKAAVQKGLAVLEQELSNCTFLVGNKITLAEICGVCTLYPLFNQCMGPELRKQFPCVIRWYETCINQKKFKDVIGDIAMIEKTPTEVNHKYLQCAAKPAAKPKKAVANADEDEDEFVEKKAKSAMDLLPPSAFNLEEWKRVYSNKDTRTEAIPWFWEKFDPEGFSLWFVEYKYNDELTKQYMICNQIGGFFNRMELLRKYAFGSMLILGVENNFKVQGVFMFRGKEIPQEMTDLADYECYSFTKLNHNDEKDKKTWDDYISWDADYAAGKFTEGKIFK